MSVKSLVVCAGAGYLKEMKHFIDSGIDVNGLDSEGWTALTIASYTHKDEIIYELLKNKKLDINKCNTIHGSSAFMYICQNNNLALIKKFLELPDLNINKQNTINGWTALMYYIGSHDSAETLRELLRCPQLNINIMDNKSSTALDLAISYGKKTSSNELINYQKLGYAEYITSCNVDSSAVKVPPNSTVSLDSSSVLKEKVHALLMSCIRYSDIEDFRKVINMSTCVDINAVDAYGWTALTLASSLKKDAIVYELLKYPNIDINKCNTVNDSNALIYLCQHGNMELIQKVLEFPNLDVNKQNKDGWSAFTSILFNGPLELIKKFVELPNLEINNQSKIDGETPLMFSIYNNYHMSCFKELLKHPKIDLSIKNTKGKTVFDIASSHGGLGVVEELNKFMKAKVADDIVKLGEELCPKLKYFLGTNEIKMPVGIISTIQNNSKQEKETKAKALEFLILGIKYNTRIEDLKNLIEIVGTVPDGNAVGISAERSESTVPLGTSAERSEGTDNFINEISNGGWTALTYASHLNRNAVVYLLLKNKCIDINKCNTIHGSSAFMYLCQNDNLELVQAFLKLPNLEINKQSKGYCKNTALQFYIEANRPDTAVIRELLKHPELDVDSSLNQVSKIKNQTIIELLNEFKSAKLVNEITKLKEEVSTQKAGNPNWMYYSLETKECVESLDSKVQPNISTTENVLFIDNFATSTPDEFKSQAYKNYYEDKKNKAEIASKETTEKSTVLPSKVKVVLPKEDEMQERQLLLKESDSGSEVEIV